MVRHSARFNWRGLHTIVPPSTIALVKNDICIRGAGVVGQVLALLLARARIEVNLIQSAPAKQPDLRSFALNAASKQVLTDLRVWPEQATPVQRMQVYGDTTGQLGFEGGDQPLAWIVDAASLQERLASAISFAPEISLMADQAAAPAAQLTVICEGRASQTREATGAVFEQFAYAQSAIAAHVVCEKPHGNTAWQWMQSGQICALLPRGESVGGNSVALVWSVSQSRVQELTDMPAQAFEQALTEATQRQLGGLQLASARVSWPLVLAQAKQWCGYSGSSAWVLAGDAAHAVHPLAGQGLNLGLGDVVELTKVLAGKSYFRRYDDLRLLRAYERARKGDAAMLRLATDGLHKVFASQDTRLQSLRNWGMTGFEAALPLKDWVMRQASGLR
jgi:2-polyprenyl-6-methoxyphenol hydroxylase-like FAD-dependent oxidoreductase